MDGGTVVDHCSHCFIITVVLLWTIKRKKGKKGKYFLVDMLFSKLKIVIGFYQVTHGLHQAFSYIKWPGSLQVIAKDSEILQIYILQIAPVGCLFTRFLVNAFGSFLAIMAINAAVVGVSVVIYGVRKGIILRNRNLQNDDKSGEISEIKELVFRNVFFFLYVTFLSTCAQTSRAFPIACQKLCRDEKEEICLQYTRADYIIKCHGTKYNYWLIVALTLPPISWPSRSPHSFFFGGSKG